MFHFQTGAAGEPIQAVIGLNEDRGEARSPNRSLDQILAAGFRGARFDVVGEPSLQALQWRRVRPVALELSPRARANGGPLAVRDAAIDVDVPMIANPALRGFDIASALAILAQAGSAVLEIRAGCVAIDAPMMRGLSTLKERLAARADRLRGDDPIGTEILKFCGDISRAEMSVSLIVRLGAAGGIDDLTVDLVSLALFGARADHADADHRMDLRAIWAAGGAMPFLLPGAEDLARAMPMAAHQGSGPAEPGSLVIGLTPPDTPVLITAGDRARHIYLVGATGTGKSTLMLNMLAQDFAAGEGVILIDPHGDLADDAAALTPAWRREDVIFADAADAEGGFRLNILEGQGGEPALERSYVANALIGIFSQILYPGVDEAFGPMFETYFRNALLLLMEAGGHRPNLADFESVFLDDTMRTDMLGRCRDDKVKEFWTRLAPRITHDEISLINIAPYITAKLAQFTGNAQMRRILCSPEPSLDLAGAMDAGRIVILKMSKGLLGQKDCELLAAVTCLRIAQAGMARAAKPRTERRPVRLYIDEFQTCVGDGLGDMLAESRKFGISMVLANQSLSQVSGSGRRPDTGAAALANAANLIAFRVGAPDAAKLGPWFAPDVEWSALCRVPDFHAMTRVLDHGRPAPAGLARMAMAPLLGSATAVVR